MSVDQLRISAHKLEKRSRFEALYQMAACTIVLLFFARGMLYTRLMLVPVAWSSASLWSIRLGCALVCIGAGYEIHKAYKRLRFWKLVPQANLATTLQSYRTLLDKRRNYFRSIWRNKALWLLLTGMVLAAVPITVNEYHQARQILAAAAPFAVLVAIWWIAFAVIRKRGLGKLQQEIDQLNSFEREHQVSDKYPGM